MQSKTSKTILILQIFLLLLSGCAQAAAVAPLSANGPAVLAAASSTPTSIAAASPAVGEAGPVEATQLTVPIQEPTDLLDPTGVPALTELPEPTNPAEPTASPTIAQPEQVSTPTPEPTAMPVQPACNEQAAFYGDITIPDDTFFEQGQSFAKTWRVRNSGDCTWTPDYKVVFHSGEIFNAPLSQPLPETVLPGGTVDLTVNLSAPTRGGTYQGFWWLEDPAGTRFGTGSARSDPFWVRIQVRFLDQQDKPQANPALSPGPAAPQAGCAATRDPSIEQQTLTLINHQRQDNGQPLLSANSTLTQAALVHSLDMSCNNFVGHNGTDGSNWYNRIAAQGYSPTNANENIYVGFPQYGGNAQGAVGWWMNSPIHRDNILNPDNSDIGVGYVYNPNSEYGGYYTVVFARP